jgi:hypothetical protein
MKNPFTTRVAAVALALASASASMTQTASADSAFPTSIAVYPYPAIASPSRYPVTVLGCGVFRLGHRLHIGFTFKNLTLHPMTAVKISVDLYDEFHTPITTLDSSINGNYTPNAIVTVPEFRQPDSRIFQPENQMPVFEAYDVWPSAASAVCYVTGVLYDNGDVWNETSRPSLESAMHQLDNMRTGAAAAAHAAVAKDLAQQKALGYTVAMIAPAPANVPDGWKTVHEGMYVDARRALLVQMLAYVQLKGSGATRPLVATDSPLARALDGIEITDQHETTVCDGKTAQFLAVRGTSSSGPQIVETIKLRSGTVSYVASYMRPIDAPASAQAEAALQNICY